MAMMNEMEYRTIGSALAGGYRAAVYCRLSKDDDLQGESASIANQRDMLEKYCEKQGWEVVAVYQDDGFTGLNMERPDLQRMLRAIERRQINLVITKDLSRLGRNYLQTGHLIEDFFPRNGVRYIAMNDGIDTLRDNNDIAPFKNILNEMYSKDISKKVHSSYLLKAQKGQFTGCLAPFGYRKDPEDKNHLLIDEETAPIVRLIFGYALTRSFYHGLVKHGVRVYEWTPGFCHAKMSVADDCMATCGTINLDYRSLYHHFENGCFMADCQAVVEIKNDLIRTMGECRDVTDQYQTGRSAYLRLGQLFMRLFAGLL